MAARRWLVLGVLLLSGAQTVYWLGGGFLGALVAGFILAALGLVSLLRWIDGGVAKGGDAER